MYCSVSENCTILSFYLWRLFPPPVALRCWRNTRFCPSHSVCRASYPVLLATTNVIKIFCALIHREVRCVVINGNRTVIRLTLRLEEIDDAIAARAIVSSPLLFHRDAVPSANSNLSSRQDISNPHYLHPCTLVVCETAYHRKHQHQRRLHKYSPVERPRKNVYRFIHNKNVN